MSRDGDANWCQLSTDLMSALYRSPRASPAPKACSKGKNVKKTQVHPHIIWHLNPTSILNPIWNAIWHTNAEWEWALAFACHKWVSEMTSLCNLEISGGIWRLSGVYSCFFSIASLCFIMLHCFSPLQSCQLPSTADLPISFGDAIGAGNTKAGSSTGSGSTAEILPRDDQIGTLMESKLQVKSLRTRQISTGHFTISVSNSFSVVF